MALHEQSADVAQMDAVDRLGVAIKRIALLEAEIERLRAALETIAADCMAVTRDQTISDAEIRAWKATAIFARNSAKSSNEQLAPQHSGTEYVPGVGHLLK